MKYNFLTFLIVFTFINCGSGSTSTEEDEVLVDNISKITYRTSSKVISNPERGFMHSWSADSEGNPIDVVRLENLKNENVTLILRLYYLDAFKDSDLSVTQLDLIKTDFERLREAGIKCVLRFAYNSNQDHTDAPLSIIERHLDQLKPLFTDNADVISFVQAGFIGSWGEWFFTTNNLNSLANQKAVVDKLLEVLPKEIKIQLRTPLYKQTIFDTSNPIDASIGYGTTDIARVGFHNDCFLASANDIGTYQDIIAEKNYISQEALFVPTGGETCPPVGISSASCIKADVEMSLLKWTYLNLDYYGPVLNVWRNDDCFEDFQKELGYRILLKSSSLEKEIAVNGNLELNAIFDNIGFAPVYSTKNTFLIFKTLDGVTTYKKELQFDIRKVIPAVNFDLNESVSLSGIPAGQYQLFLKIEDTFESLSDRPEYSIQLANDNTWDATEGINDLLHTLTIN